MDRKSIIVIASCLFLIVLWNFMIVPKLNPPRPMPPGATNAPVPTLRGDQSARDRAAAHSRGAGASPQTGR